MPPSTPVYDSENALVLLRLGTGHSEVAFREGQEEAIRHIVEGRGRLLVVQKTGWGKSFVYFIAVKLLREARLGPALLISPLLALMRNQIIAANRMGISAVAIHSDNQDEWSRIEELINQDEVDILLISPERLANERFRENVLAPIAHRISLLVIDEAHCISDWGHDFRPHYRLIERIARSLPQNLRLLATTATANNRVMADLQSVLGPNLQVLRGDLNRPSLVLQTIRLPDQAQRMAWLAQYLRVMPGSGIIYALTKRDAERLTNWLRLQGHQVAAYTGESGPERESLENDLLNNKIKALVATTALGMGYDKPDLAFVVHYQTPGSVVAYYQQVGRAGRALKAAYGILLSGREELDITGYFIKTAFPTREEVRSVLAALEAEPRGLSVPELLGRVNASMGRIQKCLDLLSLESPAPIVKVGAKWQLTAANLGESFWVRAVRLTELRRTEQAQMQEYVSLSSGHMEYLIHALDGTPGQGATTALSPLPVDVDPKLVQEAVIFLRRTHLPIEPRKAWPSGGLPLFQVKGKISPEFQAQPGKALCLWGDAGWGDAVRKGKYHFQHFDEHLLNACANMVKQWNPTPKPTWVTCIPSLRHPALVPDFARRMAEALGLPFHQTLIRIDFRPEQKTMANSVQQARNVDGSLALSIGALPSGPVFLVDDMVDSRWTLTIAAWLLRSNNSGEVFPLVLADAGYGS